MSTLLNKDHVQNGLTRSKAFTLGQIDALSTAVAKDISVLASVISESDNADFTGATSITGGISGLVPAPQAGDESKFLRGDGSWATVESGGSSIAVFTGATTDNGTSGLVPAPRAGDNGKFLRGDGVWATVESGSAGGAVDYVIGSKVSSVEGGFWQDTFNDAPVLKLRHGDYEYNFIYDNITYLGGASSVLVNTTPNTYVLGTASVSNDGGVWYEVDANDVPTLNLHKGNYNYGFNYDSITYKGDNSHLAAYLPFDASTTADAGGNEWMAMGNTTLDAEIKKFGTASVHLPAEACIQAENIIDLEAEQWTFDTWVLLQSVGPILSFGTAAQRFWGIHIDNGAIMFGDSTHTKWEHSLHYEDTFPQSAWFHLAIVKDGLTFYCFCNGSLFWNPTVTSFEASNNVFRLGGNENYGNGGDAYFDNVRFFEGVALWTSNFTPPTAEDYM